MSIIELLERYLILRSLGLIADDPTIDQTIELVFVGDAIPGTINGM